MQTVLASEKMNEIMDGGCYKNIYPFDIASDNVFDMDIGYKFRTAGEINAGDLSNPGYCFFPDEKAECIYETMKLNPAVTEFTIIEDNTAIGFFTRTAFNELLGGQYGFSLFSKTSIREIIDLFDNSVSCLTSLAFFGLKLSF